MKMLLYLLWVISLWVSFTGSFESRVQRPPIVALLGLLGMVLGEQLGISVKKARRSRRGVRLPYRREF